MSPYKVIIAPDSFKESMSAKEAALAIKDGFQEVFDSSTIYDIIPMADGGEGTTEVLKEALNATSYCVEVKDPLNRNIMASYARSDEHQTAIIEMTAASGLALLSKDERDPSITTSYGTGQLINDALNKVKEARNGSHEDYGKALDELDRAVEEYQKTQQSQQQE